MKNHLNAKIIVVETYRLHLKMGYLNDLAGTYYIFIISKKLIFLSRIDKLGYYLTFGNDRLSIFYDSIKVDFRIIHDSLCKINLNIQFVKILVTL